MYPYSQQKEIDRYVCYVVNTINQVMIRVYFNFDPARRYRMFSHWDSPIYIFMFSDVFTVTQTTPLFEQASQHTTRFVDMLPCLSTSETISKIKCFEQQRDDVRTFK